MFESRPIDAGDIQRQVREEKHLEYTDKFDINRFIYGESCYDAAQRMYMRLDVISDSIIFNRNGGEEGYCYDITIRQIRRSDNSRWRMKPKADDGWIKHDGGPCPIPWAKAGEWEFKTSLGTDPAKAEAAHCEWRTGRSSIVSYRLTDGWIPVVNGRCPASLGWKSHEWEWRDSKGNVETGYCDITDDSWSTAVAVRLIKRPDKSILETRDHKEPGISRVAKSTKSTLGEQIEHAKAQYDSWPSEKKKSVQLQGQDIFLECMASFEEKRAAKKRKNPVPEIGMREMLAIAGRAMED